MYKPETATEIIASQAKDTAPIPGSQQAPTWAALVAAEPRLGRLLERVREAGRDHPHVHANRLWYGRGGFRQEMEKLVGFARRGYPMLSTCEAYDLAYDRLYNALSRATRKSR